jgi:hypothetical protein
VLGLAQSLLRGVEKYWIWGRVGEVVAGQWWACRSGGPGAPLPMADEGFQRFNKGNCGFCEHQSGELIDKLAHFSTVSPGS